VSRPILQALGILLGIVVVAAFLFPSLGARFLNRTVAVEAPAATEAARALHGTLLVADLHSDALLWNRNLLRRSSWGHVDVPRLIEGRVGLQAFTVVTKAPRRMNIESNSGDSDNITLLAVLGRWPPRTWGDLTERALWQAKKLHRAAAGSDGRFTVIRSATDLRLYLSKRDTDPEVTAGFLGLEGAHVLAGDIGSLDRLFGAGFRMLGLTHFFDNEVGGSAHGIDRGGLTPFGREVVARAEGLGVLIDLAHASPALIDDVLSVATRPLVVSHTGVRGTCDNRRNLDDERLAAIAATGGVVGIGLWETALCGTGPDDWARAVGHAVAVAGVDHVALGSDWDGAVTAILEAAHVVRLTDALLERGLGKIEVRKVMGENVVRLLLEALPAGGPQADGA